MFAIMTSFISDYFVVHIVSISFRIQVYIQIHAADWKNSGEGFGQYSGVAERRAGRIPSPDQLPSRSAERHGGGLESRSAFGLSSCPRKAFVAFELVAAAMHLLKVAQVSRASAETHWNDFVYFDAHWISHLIASSIGLSQMAQDTCCASTRCLARLRARRLMRRGSL